jgi:hypothetical protein
MFLVAAGAGPVYRPLRKRDLEATKFSPTETEMVDGEIAFRQGSGGHTTSPDWPIFLTFAAPYFKGPPPAAATNRIAPGRSHLLAHGLQHKFGRSF